MKTFWFLRVDDLRNQVFKGLVWEKLLDWLIGDGGLLVISGYMLITTYMHMPLIIWSVVFLIHIAVSGTTVLLKLNWIIILTSQWHYTTICGL